MSYITTNIRFPEDIYMQLKEEAAKNRTSLSEIVRRKVGARSDKRSPEEVARFIAEIDKTATYLGKKLKGFDVTKAIREMREEH